MTVTTEKFSLGKVCITPRGDWSNSTQYYVMDLVRYNNNSYLAKENNKNKAPTNTVYWQLLIASTADQPTIDENHILSWS